MKIENKLEEDNKSKINKMINLYFHDTELFESMLSKIKGPRCGICGCFVEWKTKFIVEECPDDIPQWK